MALYIWINLDEANLLRQLARGRDRNLIKQYTFALLYSGNPDGAALVPLALYYRIWDKGDPCDDCSDWLTDDRHRRRQPPVVWLAASNAAPWDESPYAPKSAWDEE